MNRVYALAIEAHEQCGVDVGSICWGTCGKAAVAGIDLGEYGSAIPCLVPASECPHFDKEMGKPMCTSTFGEDPTEYEVIIRKIGVARSGR